MQLTDDDIKHLIERSNGKLSDHYCRMTLYYVYGILQTSSDEWAKQNVFNDLRNELDRVKDVFPTHIRRVEY